MKKMIPFLCLLFVALQSDAQNFRKELFKNGWFAFSDLDFIPYNGTDSINFHKENGAIREHTFYLDLHRSRRKKNTFYKVVWEYRGKIWDPLWMPEKWQIHSRGKKQYVVIKNRVSKTMLKYQILPLFGKDNSLTSFWLIPVQG